ATEYKPSGSIRLQSSAHAPALPLGCEGEFRVREGGSRSAEEPPCRALGQVSDSRALEVGEGSHADVDLGEVLTEVGAEAVRGEGPLVAPVMGGVSAVGASPCMGGEVFVGRHRADKPAAMTQHPCRLG